MYQKFWWYDLQFLRYSVWQTEISNLILQICLKNHNHMRHGSWDTEWDWQNLFSFWSISCPFTIPSLPPTTRKIKILNKWKKHLEMSSFSACVPKIIIIWCMLPEIWSATDRIFCHFGPFFALLPHYWPQTLKFGKNFKNSWIYYPFTHVHHK